MVTDWLERRALLSPDRVALIDTMDGGREISYREWNRNANRTARFLHDRLGIRKGDRVAVLARNSVHYLDIWFALGKLGAILQNLNWRLTESELERLLEDGTPRALIYGSEFSGIVSRLRPDIGGGVHRILLDGEAVGGKEIPFDARDAFPDDPPPLPELSLDDPWVICYTGGTTGLPKGAILTHGNITWNSINTVVSWGLTPEDMTILNAPLFHTGGLNVFTAPLVHIGGASIVCREFNVEQVFDLLHAYPITLYFGVPTMFIAMHEHPCWEEADFSRVRLLISGGAPCPLPLFERFWARDVDFKAGYGLTEAGPNTFWLPPADVRRKPGSVGFPLFHVEVRVVNERGEEAKAGETGELLIRGPHVSPGYWRQPEATAEAIRDGWLHTGDLARRDDEGYYSIVGRLKEMIISGGENIYPAEVESVLAGHPAVAEVALIGVPHERWGEVGCAFIVPRKPLAEEDLLAYARERLARYKVPRQVIMVEALPKTGAGKVDKQHLERLCGVMGGEHADRSGG